MNKIIKIIGIVLLSIIFLLILFNLDSDTLYEFDNYIYSLSQTINSPLVTLLTKTITSLASPEFSLFVILLCIIFVKNNSIKKVIVGNAVIVTLINQVIKLIVQKPRPEAWMIVEETGYSFPSAHAMFSLAFYGIFLYYINKSNIAKKWKILLNVLLLFLIITIPITRIYLGVHYASDVIAGLCLSGILLIIYSFFTKKKA